jgi:hypothetical protein
VNLFGDLGKLQVLPRNGYEAVQGCYDVPVALTSDPQAVQLLAVQDPNMSSLPPNRHPPGMQSRLSVRVGVFRSD